MLLPDWYFVTLAALLWLLAAAAAPGVPWPRRATVASAALSWLGFAWVSSAWGAVWWRHAAGPVAALLGVYAAAAQLYTMPWAALERVLLEADARLARAIGWSGLARRLPRAVLEIVEFGYLFAYPLVPFGAAVVAARGRADALDHYWNVVVSAGVVCYAVLPLLPTRPPRLLVAAGPYAGRTVAVRRFNVAVLARVSSQVNTIPSGHAATACAVLLAAATLDPRSACILGPLAVAVIMATVSGRYHFAVDTVAGVLVALAAWQAFR
jgi:hypothetical protein